MVFAMESPLLLETCGNGRAGAICEYVPDFMAFVEASER